MSEERHEDRMFTAGDVRDVAALSYRQQSDWDRKGVLPETPRGTEMWRRYTPRELFAIMVCAEIRKQYGVPVDSLKWVREFMLQDGANHFLAALRLVCLLDLPVLLLTDCRSVFVIDSTLEFLYPEALGFLYATEEEDKPEPLPSAIVINVAPLLRRLALCLKPKIELPRHKQGFKLMSQIAGGPALTADEMQVLSAIRSGDFTYIEVSLRDGGVERLTMKERLDATEYSQLSERLAEHEFQRITVTKRDGAVVSLEREISIKPSAKRDRKPRSAKEAEPHESD